jgi:acetyltransferase-like isoleucine patch superfamily enzyme
MPNPVPKNVRIHSSAEVAPRAVIEDDVSIWNQVQIREGASIGSGSIISKNAYIDVDVSIGANCKIQNNVSVFQGVRVEDGVFIGPHVCFTNDRIPRAINPDGSLKSANEWTVSETVVEYGASIGAHSVILPGVRLGRFSMVGAGSVVTRSVPDNGMVIGNPARLVGWVCDCGARLQVDESAAVEVECRVCGRVLTVKNTEK